MADKIVEGDVVQDVSSPSITLSREELEALIKEVSERAAYVAYEAAEAQRQRYQRTPDGLLDRTIRAYKPVPYQTALSQSTPLLLVDGSGSEKWHIIREDDDMEPQPSLLDKEPSIREAVAERYFTNYPRPLFLSPGEHPGKGAPSEFKRRDVSGSEESRADSNPTSSFPTNGNKDNGVGGRAGDSEPGDADQTCT